jgi:hypothetical protein
MSQKPKKQKTGLEEGNELRKMRRGIKENNNRKTKRKD